jgi:hypothetical protein
LLNPWRSIPSPKSRELKALFWPIVSLRGSTSSVVLKEKLDGSQRFESSSVVTFLSIVSSAFSCSVHDTRCSGEDARFFVLNPAREGGNQKRGKAKIFT